MSISFELAGGTVNYDWDTEFYTKVRSKFYEQSKKAMEQFENRVVSIPNGADCGDEYGEAMYEAAIDVYSSFEDLFIERGCFSFSSDMLTRDPEFRENLLEPMADLINDLKSDINSADEYKEAESERRAFRKASRGRVIGGGFGLGGYVKGAMTAGAINSVTGLAHGLFNAVGNVATSIEASGMKDKAYAGFKQAFVESAYEWIDVVRLILIKQLKIKVGLNITEASTIMQNIALGKIKEEYKVAALTKALEAYPYDYEVYEKYLEVVPADEDVIYKMTEHFGFDASGMREKIHNFDGVYFDSGEDKKNVHDTTYRILSEAYAGITFFKGMLDDMQGVSVSSSDDIHLAEDIYNRIFANISLEEMKVRWEENPISDNAEAQKTKKALLSKIVGKIDNNLDAMMEDALTEKYWLDHLDEKLPGKLGEEFQKAAVSTHSSQAKAYFQSKSEFFLKVKEKSDAKLNDMAEVLGNAYFQDIVREVITLVPSEKIDGMEKIPNISEDHLDCAYRGYLRDFNVEKKNVYLLCNSEDSVYSDMSSGFALTYEGLLGSSGSYFLYDQIADIKFRGNKLCVIGNNGKINDFTRMPGSVELMRYFRKIFSYIFHPETMPDAVFEQLKVRLNNL